MYFLFYHIAKELELKKNHRWPAYIMTRIKDLGLCDVFFYGTVYIQYLVDEFDIGPRSTIIIIPFLSAFLYSFFGPMSFISEHIVRPYYFFLLVILYTSISFWFHFVSH